MAQWGVTADVDRFDEAADWFAARVVITADQARALDARAKADAFWVGASLQLDQIQDVFDRIKKAEDKGLTYAEWRDSVRGTLGNDFHAETVYRNATQRQYNAGRWLQMQDPETLRFRPLGLVDAVLDDRTTEYCESVNDTILPLDHIWWRTHWFPAHHRCRTSVRNITAREAERRGGVSDVPGDDLQPQDGFGAAPTEDGEGWRPAPGRYDPQLRLLLDQKAPRGMQSRVARPQGHEAAHWTDTYKHYGEAAASLAHGRAALERGLDMPAARARELLAEVDAPGVAMMREALIGADDARTIREQAGELEPLRKAAAAMAGHLDMVSGRAAVKHAGLARSDRGRRALAFFSRVTGAKVRHPEDWTFRRIKGRANANRFKKRINWRDVDGVLEHEWGHALEDLNPTLLDRAVAFLERRAAGETRRQLRHLVPGSRYGPREYAWEDAFLHPYVGKDYRLRSGRAYATELTTMAVELLVAGRRGFGSLAELVRKDPEHFLFLLGQLAGE